MQKSIKKIFSLTLAIAAVISMLPATVFAAAIEPLSTATPALYSSYNAANVVDVAGGKKVPSDSTNGIRVYSPISHTGETTYSYGTYLVYSLDVNVNQRVETGSIATNTYGRIYFESTYAVNLPLEAIGTTGDNYKLTVIVTPDKEIYTYCNYKLYRESNSSLPESFKQIRYYEKPAVGSTEQNIITFTNPTVTHYANTCALADVLAAHSETTKSTVAWTAERGVDLGNNTFTSDSNGTTRIKSDFGKSIKVGTDSFSAEGSIRVNKRVETEWRNEASGIGLTILIDGLKPDSTAYTAYANPKIDILAEGKEYPFAFIVDRNKQAYISIGDSYVIWDISDADTITSIRYYEGVVKYPEACANEFVFEPLAYTFYSGDEGINDVNDMASVTSGTEVYYGISLVDGDVDLKNATDIDGNKPLTEDIMPYSLIAAKFTTALSVGTESVEYGLMISEEISGDALDSETCTYKAVGARNVEGCYGILIYGESIVSGKTFYAKPYLKYLNKYYYGQCETVSFPGQAE